jgi:hypothetical protein
MPRGSESCTPSCCCDAKRISVLNLVTQDEPHPYLSSRPRPSSQRMHVTCWTIVGIFIMSMLTVIVMILRSSSQLYHCYRESLPCFHFLVCYYPESCSPMIFEHNVQLHPQTHYMWSHHFEFRIALVNQKWEETLNCIPCTAILSNPTICNNIYMALWYREHATKVLHRWRLITPLCEQSPFGCQTIIRCQFYWNEEEPFTFLHNGVIATVADVSTDK